MPNLKEKEAEIMEDMKRQALEEIEERKAKGLPVDELKEDFEMHYKPFDTLKPDGKID
jgi:hypothetical protein